MSNPTIFSSHSNCDTILSIPIYAFSGMIAGKLCQSLSPVGGILFGATYASTQIVFNNMYQHYKKNTSQSLLEKITSFVIPYFTSIVATSLLTSSLGHSISISSSILTSAAINITATIVSTTISMIFVSILVARNCKEREKEVLP